MITIAVALAHELRIDEKSGPFTLYLVTLIADIAIFQATFGTGA